MNYQARNAGGLSYRLHATPVVWLGTGAVDENEFIAICGGQLWHEGSRLRIGIGLAGRWFVSMDGDGVGEETMHQLGFGADIGAGRLRPGVHVRIPLDEDLRNIQDFVLGIGLQIALR